MCFLRWWAGLAAGAWLCTGCAPSGATTVAGSEPDAGKPKPPDPPAFTRETLGGVLTTPADANVAWAHAFPGELTSPPQVALGPAGELIAMVTIARRPRSPYVVDSFLMRFDAATGELRWMQPIEHYAKFALDTQGNIVLAWPTELQKLDPDGNVLWTKSRPAENAYELVTLAVDNADNPVLARVELDQSPNALDADPHGYVELDKLDSDGEMLWTKRFGDGSSYLQNVWVTTDRQNAVVLLAAGLDGAFDFGGGPLGRIDALAKYDAGGNYVFSKALDAYGPIFGPLSSPVQTDAAGNIFLRADSLGEIDIGLGSIFCIRYALKFGPAGDALWNDCVEADDWSVLPDGSFLTSTTLERDETIGDRSCTVVDRSADGTEAEFARYDAQGQWVATECAADPGYQFVGNVAPDPSGMFFMTAAFENQLTLPDGAAVPALDSWYTALIAKVSIGP